MNAVKFILFCFFGFALQLNAQTISISGKTVICLGETTTLKATMDGTGYGTTNYVFEIIDYTTHPPFSGGVAIDPDFTGCTATGHDDCFAPPNGPSPPDGYPIGFTFCFFNLQYDRFWVGSNGWIGFTNPTGHSWTTFTATTIPNAAESVPKNCIFAPWQDWFPGANDTPNAVYYYTSGTAPDRKLVVYWTNCPLYGCQDDMSKRGTFMIVLNEQSSIIENFIQKKPQCVNSSEGATQGVHNIDGTDAYTATNRNLDVWTAFDEGTRFNPSGINWYKDVYPGGTYIGYGSDLIVSPLVTTTYFAVVGTCDGSMAVGQVTVTVNPLPVPTFLSGATTACKNDVKTYTTENTGTFYTWGYPVGTPVIGGGGHPDDFITLQWTNPGSYSVSVNYKNEFGCEATTPTVLNVTVEPFDVPVINTAADEYCPETEVTFTTQAGKTNYVWEYAASGAELISGQGTNTIILKWSTPGLKTVTVNYTDPGGCTGDPPTSKQITIKPTPIVDGPLVKSICSGDNTGISLISAPPGADFSWISPAPLCSGNIVSCPPGSATGTLISDVLLLDNSIAGTVKYYITPLLDGCIGSIHEYLVEVNPLPVPIIDQQPGVPLCLNSTLTYTTEPGKNNYDWQVSAGGSIAETPPYGNEIHVTWSTTGNKTVTVNYIDPLTLCTAAVPTAFLLFINPLPTASIAGTTSVCLNSTDPLITFTGGTTAPPYTFTYNINGGPDQTITTTVGNSVTVGVPTLVAGTFTYNLLSVQDAGTTNCSQLQPGIAIVTVNPLPTASISGSTTACRNSTPPLITFTGGAATPPYTFTYNINGGPDQNVTTIVGNNVTVTAPTGVVGTFAYNLISVMDATATACSQLQTGIAAVTVNPLPTATIAGSTTVCRNATSPLITFTGGDATPPYTFTYNINGGPDQTVTTIVGNSVTLSAPTDIDGTFNYNLVSAMDASSTTCSQLQSGIATVVVNPLPTATITGTTTVCLNSTAPLITLTGGDATPPYTFTFNINGGPDQTVSTLVGNSVTVAAPTGVTGTFAYNLVSVQEASSTACSQLQAGIATVIVNPLPTATIAGSTTICRNAIAPLITFTGGAATPPYTFTYNINGGPDQTVTTIIGNSVTVTAPTAVAGTFNYNLVSVMDASSTTCSQLQAGIATVIVNPLPVASIAGTTSVCLNLTAPLITFTGGASTPPYTFTYNINGGADQTVTTAVGNSVTVNAPAAIAGTFNYNLVSVKDASSTACSQLQAGVATVTVNPLPAPTITGPAANCLNTTSNYTTETGNGITGYSWNLLSGGTIANQNTFQPTVTWTATGTHTINVNYIDANGCTAVSPTPKLVVINTLPDPTITGAAAVCEGDTKTYNTETGAVSYSWTYPAAGITVLGGGGAGDDFITIRWDNPATYTLGVNFVIGTGCTAPTPTIHTVVVNPNPIAVITGPTSSVCGFSTQNYHAVNTGDVYQWTITGGTLQPPPGLKDISVLWGNNPPVAVDLTEKIIYPGVTCTDDAPTFLVSVKSWPVAPDPITGPEVVCQSTTQSYSVPPIQYAMTHQWVYTGSGATITGNGTSAISIAFSAGASSGILTVTGNNDCGDGPVSAPVAITVNPLPVVSYTLCNNAPITTKNAKPFILKGGSPFGATGTYHLNNPAIAPLPGDIFNPADVNVFTGSNTIYYTYTDVNNCKATAQQTINVFPSNSNFQCLNIFTDPRDNNTYHTVPIGAQCWMQENLRYGSTVSFTTPQTDNCQFDRYCLSADNANCSLYGGFYQWDELMQYDGADRAQGFCPPGWHLPNEMEWDNMINSVSNGTGYGVAASFLKDMIVNGSFKAYPAGVFYLNDLQSFVNPSPKATFFWTSTYNATTRLTVTKGMSDKTPSVSRYESVKANAFPVRCVKD